MANYAKYVRNRDIDRLPLKKMAKEHGVLLTRYFGTVADATKRKVPLFNRNGTYKGNLG